MVDRKHLSPDTSFFVCCARGVTVDAQRRKIQLARNFALALDEYLLMLSRRSFLGLIGASAAMGRSLSQSKAPATARLEAGGCAFAFTFDSADFPLSRDAVIDWVAQCARTVSDYLGNFPVPEARLRVSLLEGNLTLSGLLTFQQCSDTVCEPPEALPFELTLTLKPFLISDREREQRQQKGAREQ